MEKIDYQQPHITAPNKLCLLKPAACCFFMRKESMTY